MDGSPNSQSSGSRSRPSYVHPILNEDDRSHKSERASTSPSLLHLATNPPDYDPEAPFPHTDSGYAYIHTPTGIVQDTTLPRFPSGPSSPTAPYSPHVQQQQQLPRPQSRSQVPSPAYTTPTTTSVITRISQPEYYHGNNIPFLGAPPIAQNIPLIQAPSGGFLCEQCSQTFTRAHDLRRHHISKHSEIKCQCICGRNFSRKDALLRHQRSDPASGYAGCEEAQQALLETAANSGSS